MLKPAIAFGLVVILGLLIVGCNRPSAQSNKVHSPTGVYRTEGSNTAQKGDTLVVRGDKGLGYETNSTEQLAETAVNLTQTEAIRKARNVLTELGVDFGAFKKAEMSNDPVIVKEYWHIRFARATVDIDPVNKNVIGIAVLNSPNNNFTIKDTTAAKKAAQELYVKLQAPADYKLVSIRKSNTGDFWSTSWEKEVIPGVYSQYESVNLVLSSASGKLRQYRLFNTPARSLEVKISKDQAVEVARTIAEAKGFETLKNAELNVERANHYWDSQVPSGGADHCTLVWVVTFRSTQSQANSFNIFDGQASVYVDALTGSVIGGDQTK